jgi:hypothetical protein
MQEPAGNHATIVILLGSLVCIPPGFHTLMQNPSGAALCICRPSATHEFRLHLPFRGICRISGDQERRGHSDGQPGAQCTILSCCHTSILVHIILDCAQPQ